MNHSWTNLTTIVRSLTGIFLALLILLQRGRGGGLAGAFGGPGTERLRNEGGGRFYADHDWDCYGLDQPCGSFRSCDAAETVHF